MPPRCTPTRRRSALSQKITGSFAPGCYRLTPTPGTGDPAPGVYCGLHFLTDALARIRPAVHGMDLKRAGLTSSKQE